MAKRSKQTAKPVEKAVVGGIDDHRVLVEYKLKVNGRALAQFVERELDDSRQAVVLRSSFLEDVRANSRDS